MSSKGELDPAELKRWSTSTPLTRPFLSTWIGTWFIFLGVTVLLISSLFLTNRPKRADWTSFWGMMVVTLGGSLFSASTFINQPILISVGGVFLTLGLLLYGTFLAWKLNDDLSESIYHDFDHYEVRAQRRAILGVVSMITTMIGNACLVRKSFQRLIRPYFGPPNYILYGSLLFGSGAFSFLILNIASVHGVDHHVYHPLSNSAKFGSFLFSVGAFIMLLAVSRSFYSFDLLIVPNFPSVTSLKLTRLQALIVVFSSIFITLGGFLLVVGKMLLSSQGRERMITTASVLQAFGYVTIAQVMILKKTPNILNCAVNNIKAFAMGTYALGTGLYYALAVNERYFYASDLRTASMAIGIVASLLPFLTSYKHASRELFSAGNFNILSDVLSFSGFLSIFLSSLSVSADQIHNCQITCQGTLDLGYIFLFASGFILFFFYVVVYDLATIEDPSHKSTFEEIVDLIYSKKTVRYHSHNIRAMELFGDWTSNVKLSQELKEASKSDSVIEIDVLVIGCGPTGLTLTNELGIRNARVIVIDSRTAVTLDSRFFNLACTTAEGLKRIGVLGNIIERSIPQTFGHGSISATGLSHEDNKIIASALGPSRAIQQALGHQLTTAAASMVFSSKWAEQMPQRCMQSVQELCLKEKAESLPSVDVKYGWELIDFYDNYKEIPDIANSFVISRIQNVTTKEILVIKSKFLVGCDGPGSTVSKAVGAKFDGYVNLGQTRTIHFHAEGLLEKVRSKLGESLQYHVARPGYGVGWFVMNDIASHAWTFFLIGLCDGRTPRQLSKEEMIEVVREFLGPDLPFSVVSDAPWFWNLFFARRFVYGNVVLCGDSSHSWPPFGGMGGNTCYGDANNLGWKLASIVNGWGFRGMLDSYDLERREYGLRMIMLVLNFAPDRSQLMRLATIAKYPWLWWTIKYRWEFGSRGAHSGNHFFTEGILFGSRYHSQIIYRNEAHQGVEPLECPPSLYTPVIAVGGRIPHIKFASGQSINDLIALNGYTLLVIDPAVEIRDVNGVFDIENREIIFDPNDVETYPIVNELRFYFEKRKIPLTVVDLRLMLAATKDPYEQELKNLYLQQKIILVRPDLYISWSLYSQYNDRLSCLELEKLAQFACAEVCDEVVVEKMKNTSKWLTNRFITNIQGYKHLHPQAIYIENEDKALVMQTLAKKNNSKTTQDASPPMTLVTKAGLWEKVPQKEPSVESHLIEIITTVVGESIKEPFAESESAENKV